jgi:hypothetical protein
MRARRPTIGSAIRLPRLTGTATDKSRAFAKLCLVRNALDLGDALLGSIEARHRLLYGYRAPVGTEMSGYGHPPAVSVHCRDRPE